MMSSNSFNSSYQFAESLCYTTSIPLNARTLSNSYSSQGRPISYSTAKSNYRRSYAWTNQSDPDMKERKRQSSFISNSYSNLSYIDYDSDSDSDSDDSHYDSDSGSTLNNDTIPSPSMLSESTIYSSTVCSSVDNSLKCTFSPKQKVVSFSEEVDIIKPSMIENGNKKNILKKAFKIIKMKRKESK
ncbi:hypothetical protein H8356DRAFT_1664257 [Neocallimastix lanati (nom. inval.)]|nr:hypothetical protein H8356DRAFT_1664257 [Neocallimastix sp. JGI-2020a]